MSKRFSMRRRGVLAALLTLVVAGAARAAQPDVLQQVPGDAYGVIVINNVRTLGTRVANAATRLDLPLPPDPVGYLTRTIGINEGFDPNGSAALVLLKPAADKLTEPYFSNDGQPPAVLLLPTTNAKVMLEPFKPGDADKDGISSITMPDNPDQHGYVSTVANKWVAIALKREDLASYVARGDAFTKKVSASTLKVFDANDLVIWSNVEKLSIGTDKWLDDRKTDMAGMMELQNQVSKQDAVAGATAHAGVNLIFDFAKEFLKDTNAGMFTVRLNDSGATFGLSGDFKPDTTFGKFIASQAGQPAVTTAGLPGGNFLVAGGMKFNSNSLKGPLNDFIDGLLNDPGLAKDSRMPDLKRAFEIVKQEVPLVQGASFVFLDPAAGGKNGMLNGAMLIDSSDPQKLLQLQLESTQGILSQESMNPDLKQTMTVTPNAVTIKGVQLNRIAIKFTLREETPDKPIAEQNKAAIDVIQRMYGPDGMNLYLGVVGKRVVMIYGSDTVTLESSVSAAQANSDDLGKSAEIKDMTDQLVANPVGMMYLPIVRWVGLAPMVTGMAAPAAEPAPAKPIPAVVMSVGVTGNTMTAEMHLPISTIIGMQQAIENMQKAMQGGAAGAPPNLP